MLEIEWFDDGEHYISSYCGMIVIGKDGSWVKSYKARGELMTKNCGSCE